MKIKAFTAKTIQEAMQQVKLELGVDAVILHTRKVKKGGFMGLFSKDYVEVMAAVEEEPFAPKKPAAKKQETKKNSFSQEEKSFVPRQQSVNAYQEQQQMTKENKETLKNDQFVEFQQELAGVKQILEQVIGEELQNKIKGTSFEERLLSNDFAPEVAKVIAGAIDRRAVLNEGHDLQAQTVLEEYFSKTLPKACGIELLENNPKMVALIGATGVGKTTTIAKIAANFVLERGCSVALITADTYRISAVEQLKTYSDIIGVPLEIVYSSKELLNALQKHQDKQLILIDTAGRSQHNEEQLTELEELLAVRNDVEKHLVISSTTKYRDAADIVRKFSSCAPDRILFTKVDETCTAGTLISILHQFPIMLSYITNGQSVPDDITVPTTQNLAEWALRE